MNGPIQSRFWVLLLTAAVTLGVWKWLPGSAFDRTAFAAVVRGFSNPPWFISGQGSHVRPWSVKVFSSTTKTDNSQMPLVVSLGDDPDGFFQSSPPAPIDLAVVFTNFKRLGQAKAACGVSLAWESPDPIGLAALEKAMSGFESLVVTAPLSRGAVPSVMPPAFRKASIPIAEIQGDTTLLPVVNRISLANVVLGGENSAAGFSVLESEANHSHAPLLAKWEDRVVFAFPLLVTLQQLGCPVSKVEVKLGEYLKLGNTERVIPIDSYGRLALPIKKIPRSDEISAESVVDGNETLFQKQSHGPILLRDDRTAMEPSIRKFSDNLSATIAALASDRGMTNATIYPRLAWEWEIFVLLGSVLILCLVPNRFLVASAWTVGGICVAAQWSVFAMTSTWFPGLAVLAAIPTAILARKMIRPRAPAPASVLVDQPVLTETPAPEALASPAPPIKTTKTRKTPAKEVPAKKAVAKKTAKKAVAKKAAKKAAAPRTKKPPKES